MLRKHGWTRRGLKKITRQKLTFQFQKLFLVQFIFSNELLVLILISYIKWDLTSDAVASALALHDSRRRQSSRSAEVVVEEQGKNQKKKISRRRRLWRYKVTNGHTVFAVVSVQTKEHQLVWCKQSCIAGRRHQLAGAVLRPTAGKLTG